MGFLDSILKGSESSQKAAGSASPEKPVTGGLKIALKFSPFRLAAMKSDKINMIISIKNESYQPQLVSVDAIVPKIGQVGFDSTCISKHCEKKLGEIKPNDTVEIAVPIFSSNQAREAEYNVSVTAYTHYLDYSKVIHYTKKSTTLRVV